MGLLISGSLHILFALQATQATVTGTVSDAQTREPLPSAAIVLTDLDRSVLTNAEGEYRLRGVPAGPQHFSVRLIGYASRTLHALVPSSGELRINVSLQPQPIPLQPVSARLRVPVRGVEAEADADHIDRAASIAAIRNHPLLSEPDALLALTGGEVVAMPESPSGVNIRGSPSDQTAYELDGIPVFNPYHTAGLFSAWNPDAIASVALKSTFPSATQPDALGGTISVLTRTPGRDISVQGGLSTTQARVTADGSIASRAAFLLSLRSSYPGLFSPRDEASYLAGESGDLLAKLELPALGGLLRLTVYDSEDEIATAATPDAGAANDRNAFEWHSTSLGAAFNGAAGGADLRLQLWRAVADVDALWALHSGGAGTLYSGREDAGLLIALTSKHGNAATGAGIRAVRSSTSYRLADERTAAFALRTRTPVTAAFLEHTRSIAVGTRIDLATSLTAAAGALHFGPRARLRWSRDRLALSASFARLHQFTQSLRNAESIVGNVFPADLHAGAGPAVPVASSNLGVVSAEYRPSASTRLSWQAYRRRTRDQLMIAAREVEPFATANFTRGSADAHGIAVDAAVSTSRYGVVAGYGWQRTRFRHADHTYTPAFAAAHIVDAGIIVFPSATSSLRAGLTGALGRRPTSVSGVLEWEACNLLDRGCEFAGSPRLGDQSVALPAYLRVDAGVRKHWHVKVGDRDAVIALFGTITNVLARRNVLNYATDPVTGINSAIDMRPWSPLVVGLDYRF